MNEINFSVIIPQRNALDTLPKLLSSIPEDDSIEIIVVDNSPIPIKKSEVNSHRDFSLLWSPPEKHAGGARNLGIERAKGKWLIFADADDYFAEQAFDYFSEYLNSDADIVYFNSQGIYVDTGAYATRADAYRRLISNFLEGNPQSEQNLRFGYGVPWAKMVKASLINSNVIRFDQVRAANDIMFSVQAAYFATKIDASSQIVYYVTVNRGSLTRSKDLSVLRSRYLVGLRRNRFMKEHGLASQQTSIMKYIYDARKFGLSVVFEFVLTALRFRQNIFVGCSNWIKTIRENRRLELSERKYYV